MLTQIELTNEIAISVVKSKDQFSVDLENAWIWIGYSSKQKAKNKLIKNFEKGIDYLTIWVKTPSSGRPSESFLLTLDCFKSLSMMAGTEKGKEVRRYFLDCERQLKDKIEQPQKVKAKHIPEYRDTRKGCMDQLKRHGANEAPWVYAKVENYNNALVGIDKGQRENLTLDQVKDLRLNYLQGQVELLQRPENFARHPNHLVNTTTKAMRDGVYLTAGADAVPKQLKPRREQ